MDDYSITFEDYRQARLFVRMIFHEYGSCSTKNDWVSFGNGKLFVRANKNVLSFDGDSVEISKWRKEYDNFKPKEIEFDFYYPCWVTYGPLRDLKVRLGRYEILPCENQEDYPSTSKIIVVLKFKVKAYDAWEAHELGYFEVRKIIPVIASFLKIWIGPCEQGVGGFRLSSIGWLKPEGVRYKLKGHVNEFTGESKGWGKIDVTKARDLFTKYESLPAPKKERCESACRAYNLAQQFSGLYPVLGGVCLRSCIDTLTSGRAKHVLITKYKEKKLYSDISNAIHNDIIPEYSIKELWGQIGFELFPEKLINDSNRYKDRKSRLYEIVSRELENFLV